ncbi:MAG: hypothetical protein ACR2P3_06695 [Geminicoccaceae bacterium]
MAGPAVAVTALLAGSTALQAFGQIQAGQTADEVGKVNQELADRQALNIEIQGRIKERQLRRQAGQVFGRFNTLSAAGGFQDTGQLTELIDRSALELERDALTTRFETTEAANAARFGGEVERFAGQQSKQASRLGAFSTILGGASQGLLVNS